ncbi:chemotaxis protein CheA [Enterovirga sp. CN4-39]|uniref:chemotaxis protein CheA n=1 Tax=Enterovirga sp. CN4-39 TaxID=3400910 RepID=UPI003C07572D
MKELLEPFLAEARELLESAGEDLLALERNPQDAARIENLFRIFHTLKGSAAILDLAPMTGAMHAAEDLLAAIRAREVSASEDLVEACLQAMDQVEIWLAAIETTGGLPPDAQESGTALARLLREPLTSGRSDAKDAAAGEGLPGWAEALLVRHAAALGKPADGSTSLVAAKYSPARDCFLNGDDPLGIVGRIPDPVAVDVLPVEPWGRLAEMDPFACNLTVEILARCSREDLAAIFRLVSDQVELVEVEAGIGRGPGKEPGTLAAAVIAEQRAVLAAPHASALRQGVEDSVLAAVANALEHEGLSGRAKRLRAARAEGMAADAAIDAALSEPEDVEPAQAPAVQEPGGVARTLRVDVGRLDTLAGLVSELTVARNGLAHVVAQAGAGAGADTMLRALRENEANIGRLTGELHRAVMSMRLVPLAGVFRRFGRPVRETAAQLGKEVDFITSGGEAEADRAVAEALFELLLHVLRNAIDHGLEAPELRVQAGKPACGRIVLSARPLRDRVVLEVSDDGRGIDPAVIRQLAALRGLLDPEQAAAMTDSEAIDLIFAPGFSTASSVTDLSGRGVGMDAVRAGAQRLGGRVEVESTLGRGTTVRLVLPQTMALTPLLAVRCGHETFGLPMENVLAFQRVAPARIIPVKSARAVAWRDRTIPVVSLPERMGTDGEAPEGGDFELVVVRAGGEPVGLLVDGVIGRMEAVVRPLGGVFAGLPGVFGTTVLGDGRVLLVLDPEEILQ